MGGTIIVAAVPLLHTSWQTLLYTAVGASVLWARWGRAKLKAWIFSDLLDMLPMDQRWRRIIEFAIFLGLGCIVGIGVVNPTTPAQALTAGFGWTGFFAELPKQNGRSTRRIMK